MTDKEYGKVIYKAKKIGKNKLDFNLLISSFHKLHKDIPLSAELLSTAVAQKNEKQEKKSILKPYYFEVKNFKEVEKVLDNHGIIHIILPDKKGEGKYILKVNAEDSEKVKQLISAPKKNMTMK